MSRALLHSRCKWWLVVVLACAGVCPPARAEGPPSPPASNAALTSGTVAVASTPAKTISLAARGTDVLDVLRMLAEQGGLNLVIGQNVHGSVTLFLKEVNLWDAFLIILESNGLAYEQEGAIIKVMTEAEYERSAGRPFRDKRELQLVPLWFARAALVAQALQQLKTPIGTIVVDDVSNTIILMDTPETMASMRRVIGQLDAATQTKVFTLRYANVGDLQPRLEAALTKGIGQLDVDARTNKAIITDLPGRLHEIEGLITAFDERTGQVFIEAKIVQVELTDGQPGVDWTALFQRLQRRARGRATILGADAGSALNIATVPGEEQDDLLHALETVGRLHVISSPRITVLDNQEASMLLGTREAYLTTHPSSAGGVESPAEQVSFVDVGVKLSVTPSIKADRFISMKIRPEISQVDRALERGAQPPIPILRLAEAQTSVLVKDGTTILLAGLSEDRLQQPAGGAWNVDGLAAGSLTKTETVIFLTPHIIRGDEHIRRTPDDVFTTGPGMTDAATHRLLAYAALHRRLSDRTAGPLTLTPPDPFATPEAAVPATGTPAVSPAMALAVEGAPEAPSALPPSYHIEVRERIQRQIVRQLREATLTPGQAEIFFVLGADGTLLEAGQPEAYRTREPMKALALQALRDAAPFPPFPVEDLAQSTFHMVISAGDLEKKEQ